MAAKKTRAAAGTRPPRAPRPATGKAQRRTPRKATAESLGLLPAEGADLGHASLGASLDELRARVVAEGGAVIGSYRDPLGGHPLLLTLLPIGKVAPTPFQRDLSDAHHKRLAEVIHKTGRFLDPLIAITAPGEGFWTPNGRHRLEAMRRIGARAITALVVQDREVAWQILALNTEKAHNLKERALEVVRIYRGLLEEDATRAESSFAFYLEDPALVTIGVCYEREPRFAGGAYHPVLRRVEKFSDAPIGEAISGHEALAKLTLEVEAAVSAVVDKLKARGLTSPYLRSFVVARINPLRWIKGEPPPATEVLKTMKERAGR
ncbi:MAG: ParB N-terminal domain-containing protein, partial [Polyangiales bacterium]